MKLSKIEEGMAVEYGRPAKVVGISPRADCANEQVMITYRDIENDILNGLAKPSELSELPEVDVDDKVEIVDNHNKDAHGLEFGDKVKVVETNVNDRGFDLMVEDEKGYEWYVERADVKIVEKAQYFKKGDYLRGTADKYGVTNTNMYLGKVILVDGDGDIRITVIDHENEEKTGENHLAINPEGNFKKVDLKNKEEE